jgi:hypothetical protein
MAGTQTANTPCSAPARTRCGATPTYTSTSLRTPVYQRTHQQHIAHTLEPVAAEAMAVATTTAGPSAVGPLSLRSNSCLMTASALSDTCRHQSTTNTSTLPTRADPPPHPPPKTLTQPLVGHARHPHTSANEPKHMQALSTGSPRASFQRVCTLQAFRARARRGWACANA